MAGKFLDFRKHDKCSDNREWTRDYDDPAYIDVRANQSRRPVKYVTRNFHQLGLNPESLCYPGFLPQDGKGIHPGGINIDSNLRFASLTNKSYPQQLECLPVPTIPFLQRGCLDADVEMELRGKDTYSGKESIPTETEFHNRHFDYFDHLCYNPNDPDHTVLPTPLFVGINTRHNHVESYRSGAQCTNVQSAIAGGAKQAPCSFTTTHRFTKKAHDKRGNRRRLL
jgi:hypothetical protein